MVCIEVTNRELKPCAWTPASVDRNHAWRLTFLEVAISQVGRSVVVRIIDENLEV